MDPQETARKVGAKMLSEDQFSQSLRIKLVSISPGHCTLSMTVKPGQVNGFKVIHGGVTYAFADSALAFACNSHGRLSMALEVSMSYPAPVYPGDQLTAVAEEISLTNKIGIYHVLVTNQDGKKVGVFKGTVYRTGKSYLE